MSLRIVPRRRALMLVASGLVATFALLAVLHPGRADRGLRHVVTWTSTATLVLLFLWGWRHAAVEPAPRTRVWFGVGFVLALAALLVPAFHSSDLYAYVQTGWLQVAYDANPYTTTPADLPQAADDVMFTSTWRDVPCVYGFAFAHLCRGPARWSAGDIDLARMLFRVLGALSLFAIAWLLLHALRREGRPTGQTLYALLWSPFVLLHFVSNGHNDLLFGLLVLIALVAARDGRWWPVLPALVLAVWIKIVAVVVLPFAALFLWRRHGPRALASSLALALGLTVLVSLPYVFDLSTFRFDAIWAEWNRPAHSLVAAVSQTAQAIHSDGGTPIAQGLGALLLAGYGVLVAMRLRAAWAVRDYTPEALSRDAVLLLLVLVVLVSAKFHPWYLGLVLPAALLLPENDALRRLTIWLTVSWMLAFTGVGKARVLDFLVMTALPVGVFVLGQRRQSAGAPEQR